MEESQNTRRKGKVAQLPFEQRQQVNAWLRDGVSYVTISERLAERGFTGFNETNISNWYQGGYQEWLRNQERISALTMRRDAALEMVKELKRDGTVTLVDANELTLASLVNDALAEFEPRVLHELLADNPKQFFQLANVIASQSNEQRKREKVELDYAKYRDLVAKAKADIEAATAAARTKGGITEDTLREIEEAAKLL